MGERRLARPQNDVGAVEQEVVQVLHLVAIAEEGGSPRVRALARDEGPMRDPESEEPLEAGR